MSITTYIFNSNLINFIIVFAFVVWLINKVNLAAIIGKKCNEIAESVKNAEDEKKFKQLHLDSAKTKVANVQQEITKIIDEGAHIASNLSISIKNETEEKAQELHNKALSSLETEKKLVTADVMAKISGTAFCIAEEHIKQSIDERLHRKYIDDFIDNL